MKNKFFTEADCDMNRLSIGRTEGSISIDKANRLLSERGKVVKSYGEFNEWYANGASGLLDNTHQALIISIEPIEQDSAEKILQLIVSNSFRNEAYAVMVPGEIIERAKKLLEKKK